MFDFLKSFLSSDKNSEDKTKNKSVIVDNEFDNVR